MKTLTIAFLKGSFSDSVLVTTGDLDQVVENYNLGSPGRLELCSRDAPVRAPIDDETISHAFRWTGGNWCIMQTDPRFYKNGNSCDLHKIVTSLLEGYTTDRPPIKIGSFSLHDNTPFSSLRNKEDDF